MHGRPDQERIETAVHLVARQGPQQNRKGVVPRLLHGGVEIRILHGGIEHEPVMDGVLPGKLELGLAEGVHVLGRVASAGPLVEEVAEHHVVAPDDFGQEMLRGGKVFVGRLVGNAQPARDFANAEPRHPFLAHNGEGLIHAGFAQRFGSQVLINPVCDRKGK